MSAPAVSELRTVLRESFHLDLSALTPVQGLRVAAGVVLALWIGTEAGGVAVGAAAAGGALSGGMASLDVEGRSRIVRVAATCAGMSLATFVGSASGEIAPLHVALAALWAFASGLLVAVEPLALPIGINSLVAYLVFGRFAAPPLEAVRLAGIVGAGAALQLVLHAVSRRPPRARRELRLLGEAYAALGGYAMEMASGNRPPVGEAVDRAATLVARSPVEGAVREAWNSLVAEARRIRLTLLTLAGIHGRLQRLAPDQPGAELETLLRAAGGTLGDVAAALAGARYDAAPEGRSAELRTAVAGVSVRATAARAGLVGRSGARLAVSWRQAAVSAEALAGQCRAVTALLPGALPPGRRLQRLTEAAHVPRRAGRDRGALGRRLLANLTWHSAAARHALRLAGVVTAATFLAHLIGLARGYWIALTAAIVLRPDYASTFRRGVARAVGTLVGVAAGSGLALVLQPRGVVLGVLLAVSTAASGALLFAGYAAFSLGIGAVVVFLLSTVDASPVADAEQRVVATVIGAALALLAYRLLPTWGREQARDELASLVAAERRYLTATLAVVARPDAQARRRLGTLDRAVRLARTNAEAAVQQSLGDPSSRRIDGGWSDRVLVALRRAALAAHALRARLDEDPDWPAVPQVEPLAGALAGALDAAERRLRSGARVAGRSRLRAVHRDLRVSLGAVPGDTSPAAWVTAETDEMVDAVNTLLDLLAGAGSGGAVPLAGVGARTGAAVGDDAAATPAPRDAMEEESMRDATPPLPGARP